MCETTSNLPAIDYKSLFVEFRKVWQSQLSVFVSRSGAGAFGGGSVKIAQRVDPSTGDASEAAHFSADACGFVAILAGRRALCRQSVVAQRALQRDFPAHLDLRERVETSPETCTFSPEAFPPCCCECSKLASAPSAPMCPFCEHFFHPKHRLGPL